jgi:hypothetical protein
VLAAAQLCAIAQSEVRQRLQFEAALSLQKREQLLHGKVGVGGHSSTSQLS